MNRHAILVNKQPTTSIGGAGAKNIGVNVAASIAGRGLGATHEEGAAAASDIGILGVTGSAWTGAGGIMNWRRICGR